MATELSAVEVLEQFTVRVLERPAHVFMGIDPGAEGAIAAIHGNLVAVVDIPTFKVPRTKGSALHRGKKVKDPTKTIFDNAAIIELFRALRPLRQITSITLEIAQVRVDGKGSGAYSGFRTGCGYAMWPLFLASKGYRVLEVPPVVWKRRMGLPSAADASSKAQAAVKAASRAMALRLFPKAPLNRVKDHNRAEAVLLAEYGRREQSGW